MGGKSSTSSNTVSIPPQVLAQYQSVNAKADATANTPFQQYSTDPNAFVAPINSTEQGGINSIAANANEAQPYYTAANSALAGASAAGTSLNNAAETGITNAQTGAQPYQQGATQAALAGAQAVNPTALTGQDINQYLSPYLGDVLGSESALLNQNNQQAQAGQLGDAIKSGAFGGDRAGIAGANLNQQNELANANVYSGILNQGYNTALSTAQQQQGVGLAAGQANRAAVAGLAPELQSIGQQGFSQGLAGAQAQQSLGAQEYGQGASTAESEANLGTGAQAAALSGAQAQLGAGQVQQQTQQAGDTALFNQFQQQQSYPFQVDQFLANIAEGTGALSGSTTTATQPGSLFSDKRLKEDIQTIGKTFDGQNIIKFRYKGDDKTQIGLTAQDVEKVHPEAVGLAGGYKTVNYDLATRRAAKRGHFAAGGLAGFDPGNNMDALLAAQQGMYGPYGGAGLYGGAAASMPHGGSSYVPNSSLPVGHLAIAQPPAQRASGLSQITQAAGDLSKIVPEAQSAVKWARGLAGGQQTSTTSGTNTVTGETANDIDSNIADLAQWRGGKIKRADGGLAGLEDNTPYQDNAPGLDIPNDNPHAQLPVADAPKPQQDNTLGDIAGIAKIAMMFMNRGGKIGRADGGGVPDPNTDPDAALQALVRGIYSSPQDDSGDTGEDDDGGDDGSQAADPTPAPGLAGIANIAVDPKASAIPSSTPTGLGAITAPIMRIEGTGKNPNSSAHGPYQIIDPTFVGAYRQMFPDQAKGMSNSDILKIRSTPQGDQISAQMGPFLAKQNIGILANNGVEPTPPNVYLAHFLGPHGAMKVLNADPATPVSSLLSRQAVTANKRILSGKTAGDVVGWSNMKMAEAAQRPAYASGGLAGYADGGDPTIEPEDDTDAPPVNNSVGLGGGSIAVQGSPFPTSAPDGPVAPSSGAPANDTAKPGLGSTIMSDLKKPEVFIPLLTGISAWASAPTRNPLTALAVGLGAGAQSYQGQRQYGLEQQKVGIEQQLAGNNTQRVGIERMAAQGHLLGPMMGYLSSNYQPINQVGPDHLPMYRDVAAGKLITGTEYAGIRSQFLGALSGVSQGSSPLPVPVSGLGGQNAGASVSAVPSGNPSGASAPVVGANVPANGGGNDGVPAPAAGVAPVANSGAQPAPRPLTHAQPGTLAAKIASGAYMGAPQQLPPVDYSGLRDDSNPSLLEQQGFALQQTGDPQQASTGAEMIKRGQDIASGAIPAFTKDGQPYQGFVNRANAQGINTSVQGDYAKQIEDNNTKSSAFSAQYPAMRQLTDSLIRVNSETNSNRLSSDFADLIGAASSIPGLRDAIAPAVKDYQAAQDESHKDTAQLSILQAVSANLAAHAPAAAMAHTDLTVPASTMSPGARYNVIARNNALLDMGRDYSNDWNNNKANVQDVASYNNDWLKEHPINSYMQNTYNQLDPFPGMTAKEMLAHPRQPKTFNELVGKRKGIPFVIPDGPLKGKIGYTQ